jgi:hypothetical protein
MANLMWRIAPAPNSAGMSSKLPLNLCCGALWCCVPFRLLDSLQRESIHTTLLNHFHNAPDEIMNLEPPLRTLQGSPSKDGMRRHSAGQTTRGQELLRDPIAANPPSQRL